MPTYQIYGVVHRTKRRMVYIGVTKQKLAKRWYQHCTQRACVRLSNAIQKYGRQDFAIIPLASAVGADNASAVEVALIAQWGTFSPRGFNLTTGGEGAYERSEETKARMSIAFTGRLFTAEHRAKLSAARKGKPRSLEHIEKSAAALRGRPQSPELRAKRAAAQIGRAVSAETRAKIGAANTGRKASPEHIEKIRAASKGRRQSVETRAKHAAAIEGITRPPETRAKVSAAKLGKKLPPRSPEHLAKLSAAGKSYYAKLKGIDNASV